MSDERENEKQNEGGNNGRGYLDAIDQFLSLADFNLELTYSFIPNGETIVIPVRVQLNEDEIAARQKFYAQPEADRNVGIHKYQTDMLCSLLSGTPSGLPGFADLANDNPSASPADVLKSYFMRGGSLAEKIVSDAMEQYYKRVKPAEFFR